MNTAQDIKRKNLLDLRKVFTIGKAALDVADAFGKPTERLDRMKALHTEALALLAHVDGLKDLDDIIERIGDVLIQMEEQAQQNGSAPQSFLSGGVSASTARQGEYVLPKSVTTTNDEQERYGPRQLDDGTYAAQPEPAPKDDFASMCEELGLTQDGLDRIAEGLAEAFSRAEQPKREPLLTVQRYSPECSPHRVNPAYMTEDDGGDYVRLSDIKSKITSGELMVVRTAQLARSPMNQGWVCSACGFFYEDFRNEPPEVGEHCRCGAKIIE
ncbi:MAG TPA: hypothetical protein PKJ19_07900 [Flavobacteriales bacterium]|nr:hypothetical protein [Flavobacteriales bacterium]